MNSPMTERRAAVCAKIRKTFAGVRLEDGIGLKEGRGIDDHADAETLKRYYDQDEKHDWSAISVENLRTFDSSLCFFDSKGMRFHLPSFMLAELDGKIGPGGGAIFNLSYLTDRSKSQFVDLSPAQRAVVRDFLLELKDDPNYEWERSQIESALREYWTE